MSRRNQCRRNGGTIHQTRVRTLWTTEESYQRSRSSIHIKVHARSLPYHGNRAKSINGVSPRTDGQSERSNQWVETAIRFISDHHQTNWAPYLPIAQFAHNNWPSETTRKSPFFLLMGYHPRADWISSSSPLTTGHIAPRAAETGTRNGATTDDQGPTVMGQTP
jgi:hypothetical protein